MIPALVPPARLGECHLHAAVGQQSMRKWQSSSCPVPVMCPHLSPDTLNVASLSSQASEQVGFSPSKPLGSRRLPKRRHAGTVHPRDAVLVAAMLLEVLVENLIYGCLNGVIKFLSAFQSDVASLLPDQAKLAEKPLHVCELPRGKRAAHKCGTHQHPRTEKCLSINTYSYMCIIL